MTRAPVLLAAPERAALSAAAAARPRLRQNHNLHPDAADPVQRLLNALEPGTYIRPHRHRPGVWELFALVSGRAAVLVFEADGTVAHRSDLAAGDILEVPEGAWHTLVALEPGTAVFEVKPGPYVPAGIGDSAAWAPAEGDPDAASMVRWLERAQPGMRRG